MVGYKKFGAVVFAFPGYQNVTSSVRGPERVKRVNAGRNVERRSKSGQKTTP